MTCGVPFRSVLRGGGLVTYIIILLYFVIIFFICAFTHTLWD